MDDVQEKPLRWPSAPGDKENRPVSSLSQYHYGESSTHSAKMPAVAKRKAPPPVTLSIIKAAGLPELEMVPAVPSVQPQGVKRSPLAPRTASRESPSIPALTLRVPREQTLAPSSARNKSKEDILLPPTVSSIRRDIEKLLDGPAEGMPSASPVEGMLSAGPGVEGLPSTNGHSKEEGISTDNTVAGTRLRPDYSTTNTLKSFQFSPSMENLVNEAVIVNPPSDGQHLFLAQEA